MENMVDTMYMFIVQQRKYVPYVKYVSYGQSIKHYLDMFLPPCNALVQYSVPKTEHTAFSCVSIPE